MIYKEITKEEALEIIIDNFMESFREDGLNELEELRAKMRDVFRYGEAGLEKNSARKLQSIITEHGITLIVDGEDVEYKVKSNSLA
jgi:flagellar motor component MotA